MRAGGFAGLATLLLAAALAAGCGRDRPEALVTSAKDFIAKRDYRSAEIQLKSALQKEPALPEARYLLGVTLMAAADYPSAEKEFRKALEYKHPPGVVYPQLVRALVRQNDPEAVKKGIAELAAVKLTDADALAAVKTELGQAYLALRQPKEARAAFAEALAAKPGYPQARVGEARLAALEGDLDGAMKSVEEILAQSPGLPEALSLKAEIYLARGEVDPALAALREVVKAEPRNAGARYAIGALLIDARRYDEAAGEIEAMKKALPRDIRSRYLEALLAFRQGDAKKAEDPILQVLKVAPDHAPSLLLAGAIEYQLGAFSTAEEHLRKVVARYPQHAYARNLLALTYLRLGEPARAEEIIEPALARAPKDANVLRVAGEVAIANNDVKKATLLYERAAAAGKGDAAVRTRLGAIRLATGDMEGAVQELEAAAELDPSATQADLTLVSAYLSRKQFDKALEIAERLAKKQPQSAMPENVKGLVHAAKGDRKSARASFEKALELQFDFLPAAANLARMDIAEKQPDAARRRFETIVARVPKNEQALLALAEVQVATGVPLKDVVPNVERAVSINPTSVRARLALVGLQLRARNTKAALTAAQAAAAALPDSPPILETLGRVQLAAGEPNQAASTFNKLATVLPQSPVPLLLASRAQIAAKNFDAATVTLQRALTLQPERLDVHRDAIALYLAAGKPEDALADAKAVQKARPKEAVGHVFEAEVLAAQKKFHEAANAYAEALKRQPNAIVVLRTRALLEAAGKPSEGEALVARWLREHPKDPVVRLYLADRDLQRKSYEAAAAGYKEIVTDHPSNVVAMNNLAWTLGQLNDPAALDYAKRAYRLAPRNPAVADTLGWMLVERGEMKPGVALLRQAAATAPNALEIRLHYAKALVKAGDKAGAKKELEETLKVAGQSPLRAEAEELLKQL